MHRFCFVIALVVLLAACAKTAERPAIPSRDVTVQGAALALAETAKLAVGVTIMRPATLMAIYAGIYLADGSAVPVHAAVDGVKAQLQLHDDLSDAGVDTLYGLLEEFATVLHVDIADLLNRSDSRVETLDAYVVGLENITERSRRRSDDLTEEIAAQKQKQKEARAKVSTTQKELKQAMREKDFTTAGGLQAALHAQQGDLSAITLTLDELSTLHDTFEQLQEIAGARLAAIENNRLVLVAGLTVVDIPGVEDLGILNSAKTRRRGLFML